MNCAKRIPVLMYHRVGEPDHARDIYCIRPAVFAAQMRALAEAGYEAVCVEDFNGWRRGEIPLAEKSFVLTFDDGFAGIYDFAAPVLKKLEWPATIFVVAGKLGGQSDWEVTTNERMLPHPLLDTEQLRSLATQGFSLQSHSLLHRDLTTLETATLEHDLRESRTLIAKITGYEPMYLAYPYGRHNEVVRNAARDAGFTAAFSVESGFNQSNERPFQVRRIDVFGSDTPAMLLRKIRLGVNNGSLVQLLRYYLHRILRQD